MPVLKGFNCIDKKSLVSPLGSSPIRSTTTQVRNVEWKASSVLYSRELTREARDRLYDKHKNATISTVATLVLKLFLD